MQRKAPFIFPFISIFFTALIACFPLSHNGLFRGDDWLFEIVRATDYFSCFKEGFFPVRWSPSLEGGYGSPIYNFFPPFPLTVVSLFIESGFSPVVSLKLMTFFFTLLGGVGMFLFAKEWFGTKGGVLSACLYVLSPYHFEDAYFRNAFSEFVALNIVPFIFYGLARLVKGRTRGFTSTVLIVSSALFALSHNLSIIMYMPVIIMFIVTNAFDARDFSILSRLIRPLAAGISLSAFFILPVLYERNYVQTRWLTVGKFDVLNNLVHAKSLFTLGGVYSTTSLSAVLLCLTVSVIVTWRKSISREVLLNMYSFTGLSLLFIFFMTGFSEILWRRLDIPKLIQFPWRLLSPVSFMVSFVSGSLLLPANHDGRKQSLIAVITVGLSAIFLFAGYSSQKASYTDSFTHSAGKIYSAVYPDGERLSLPVGDLRSLLEGGTSADEVIKRNVLRATVLHEYRPVWVIKYPYPPHPGMLVSSDNNSEIVKIEDLPELIRYNAHVPDDAVFTAHIFYFPGWKLYANGKEISFSVNQSGLPEFSLPRGDYQIELRYENTPVRTAGNAISLAGLLILAGIAGRNLLSKKGGECTRL